MIFIYIFLLQHIIWPSNKKSWLERLHDLFVTPKYVRQKKKMWASEVAQFQGGKSFLVCKKIIYLSELSLGI